MSSRPANGESNAKRPPRSEGRGGGGGGQRGRGGRGAGGGRPAANAATNTDAKDASSLAFFLPKDVLANCVGKPVMVTLNNGHEVTGLLEQLDEDCNIMLSDVKHYLVEVVEKDTLAQQQQQEGGVIGGVIGGFSFKSDSSFGGGGGAGGFGLVSGSIVKTIERTKLLRECQRIILAGVNIVGIAPGSQV